MYAKSQRIWRFHQPFIAALRGVESHVSADEWPHEFNRLLARLSGQYSLQAEILEHEQEFDRLLALLQQHLSLYMMERFARLSPSRITIKLWLAT